MGGDGGYIPRRSDLVSSGQRGQYAHVPYYDGLSDLYWNRHGDASKVQTADSIKLKPNIKDGYFYCTVSDRRIDKAAFSFPCGCVFDQKVAKFAAENCPVCCAEAELLVAARIPSNKTRMHPQPEK